MTDIEREAQRAAAAFGVSRWSEKSGGYWYRWYRGWAGAGLWVQIEFEDNVAAILQITVGEYNHETGYFRECCQAWRDEVLPSPNPLHNERMARGLYCLGIEDEHVLNRLNCSLSLHEQLELRYSLPRQFWPFQWQDEAR